ncbi:MAG: HAD family phosphatase [Actinobacteria bacterium]|nr:HAD family phosphatase [Actinomycetota bacterium]
MTNPDVAAVIFDYGGVLTTSTGDAVRAWIESDALSPDSFRRTLGRWLSQPADAETPIHRLERGEIASDAFNTLLAADLVRTDGTHVEAEGLLDRMFAGIQLDEAMFDLVDDLRASGLRTGLLSNSWGNDYPHERLRASFDHLVISGDVGMRKPQPEIYELALRGLDVEPQSVVFVDDVALNIAAASSLGMRTIHHSSPVTTRALLAAMVPGLHQTGAGR